MSIKAGLFSRAALASTAVAIAFVAGCVAVDSDFVGPPEIISPRDGAVVATLTKGQKSYLTMPRKKRVEAFATPAYRQRMRSYGYYPKPLELAWKYRSGGVPTPYEVRVMKDDGNDDGGVCVFKTNFVSATPANCVLIDNLEIARGYTWEVSTCGFHTTGRFSTEDMAPRLIRLPGVPNVRDFGGRKGLGGRRVKQGMIYRSAGLNDNASYTYYTSDELLTNDTAFAEFVKERNAEIEFWQPYATNSAVVLDAVQIELDPTWVLFRPVLERAEFVTNAVPVLEKLTSIPDTFLGAAQESITFKDGEMHDFDKLSAKGPAVMMQIVDSPSDGYVLITAGGDYWWEMRSNGKTVIDLVQLPGNWRGPYTAFNYCIPVPVKKGKNLVSVSIFTGNDTWRWGYADASHKARSLFAKDMIDIARRRIDEYPKQVKERIAGAYRLDENGLRYALEVMKIKSDIDLRSDKECWGMNGSPLGETVNWYHYSSSCYGGMQEEFGREAFKKVFRVFLDERNYPIDFHCIAGQDRTGAVSFILGCLLGVEEEELFLDWEATGFWNNSHWFRHEKLFNKLYDGFDQFKGRTINDRVEAYVLDLGFTPSDIAKFRSIMLE